MKLKITLLFLSFSISITLAQETFLEADGGEYGFFPEKVECVSESQQEMIKSQLQQNTEILKRENRLLFSEQNRGSNPMFIWPVQKEQNVTYNSVWAISNYVDHNLNSPNQLLDYNCGSKTYDTNNGYNHRGVDIFLWPFSWKMMDNFEAEIVAAASGQIISKSDGNFDRSCDFNTSTPWNAVYIQHSDGSVAWYGHMKNGSLTSKNIGETVIQGEYLGVVGSSGVSTGPHLHFEVWQDASYTNLIDPYAGPCNNLNSNTWWQGQKPYSNPGINAVLTHSNHPDFNFDDCPNTEVTNENDQFENNDLVYFYLYLKDQYIGSAINVKIIRPDGSFLLDSNNTANNDFAASYWWWSRVVDMEGTWQWQATYEGETVTHTFNVGTLGTDEETIESVSIFPNPFNDKVFINSPTKINSANIVDALGKTILKFEDNTSGIQELDLVSLSEGVYFLRLQGNNNQQRTIKLIKG